MTPTKVREEERGSIKMWLLSQGATIEVLEPQSFRQEMQEMIAQMLANYKSEIPK